MIDVKPPGMITSYREVVPVGAKITVSLPEPLLTTLDRLARQWATTRSGAVAELLRRAEREELERQLEEGYAAWAETNRSDAEVFLPAQAEVVLRDQS
jgi:CopG family transcriptional regulator/antitoxin EndoAI